MLEHIARILPQPTVNGVGFGNVGMPVFVPPKISYSLEEFEDSLLWYRPEQLMQEDEDDKINFNLGFSSSEHQSYALVLMCPEPAANLLIYFHNSDEDLGMCFNTLKILSSRLRVHILAPEFVGYGHSVGLSTCESLRNIAIASYLLATRTMRIPSSRIIGWGKGLGAAGAISACSQSKNTKGLILQSPLVPRQRQQKGYSEWHRGWRMAASVFEDDIEADIREIRCPTLVVSGKLDLVVPTSDIEALFDSCLANEKVLHLRDEMGHNNCNFEFDVVAPVEAFLDAHLDGGMVLPPLQIPLDDLMITCCRDTIDAHSPSDVAVQTVMKLFGAMAEVIENATDFVVDSIGHPNQQSKTVPITNLPPSTLTEVQPTEEHEDMQHQHDNIYTL